MIYFVVRWVIRGIVWGSIGYLISRGVNGFNWSFWWGILMILPIAFLCITAEIMADMTIRDLKRWMVRRRKNAVQIKR